MQYFLSKKIEMFLKIIIDYLLGFILVILLIPFLLIISILIVLFDNQSPFFLQKRIGRNGEVFYLIKFRTMIENNSSNTISTAGDPRITRIGKFLRSTKLDEIPELINIVKGEMSFVGPRPDVPGYADKLTGDDRIVLTVKPGITGLASLKYINEEEILSKVEDPQKYNDEVIWPDKIKLNKYYVKNWSFWLDIKIIFYTIFRRNWEKLKFANI